MQESERNRTPTGCDRRDPGRGWGWCSCRGRAGDADRDGWERERTTDENGEVVIELAAGDPSDVARFDVRVRDQEQVVYIQRDDVHGVQTLVFEVGESDPAGNETNETDNESAVAAAV